MAYNTATADWRLASWPVSTAVSRVVERLAGVITLYIIALAHTANVQDLADPGNR